MKGVWLWFFWAPICWAAEDEKFLQRIVHVENMELLLRSAQLGYKARADQETRDGLRHARTRFDHAVSDILQKLEIQETDLREQEAEMHGAYIQQFHMYTDLQSRFDQIADVAMRLPLHAFESRVWPSQFALKQEPWIPIIQRSMNLRLTRDQARAIFYANAMPLVTHMALGVGAPAYAIRASVQYALTAYRDAEISPRKPQQEHALKKIRIDLRLNRIRRDRVRGIADTNPETAI